MVDFEMCAGFYVPRTDERRLRDLLDLNLRLLLTATHREAEIAVSAAAGDDLPIRTAVRFLQLAHASGNGELASAIGGLNDRLAAVRHLEPAVLSAPAADLTDLHQAIAARAGAPVIRDLLPRSHALRPTHTPA